MEFLETITHWTWWILAAALIGLEMLVPGTFLMWLGFAAALVGGVVLISPGLAWEGQFALFAVFSVIAVLIGRKVMSDVSLESDQPALNRRGEQYVGRNFTLSEAIDNGTGKVVVDDSTWKVEGPDMPEGTRVRVTGVVGVVLTVERDEAGG